MKFCGTTFVNMLSGIIRAHIWKTFVVSMSIVHVLTTCRTVKLAARLYRLLCSEVENLEGRDLQTVKGAGCAPGY